MEREEGVVVIGTRRSALALQQTELVRRELQQLYPHLTFQLQEMDTVGDKILNVPLAQVGDKGLFTKVCIAPLRIKHSTLFVIIRNLKQVYSQAPLISLITYKS